MNRGLRRVFDAYARLLLVAVLLPPWRGRRLAGGGGEGEAIYAPLWAPPRGAGWVFAPDLVRLLLEVLSLSLVLAAAAFALRDGRRPAPRTGRGRQSD